MTVLNMLMNLNNVGFFIVVQIKQNVNYKNLINLNQPSNNKQGLIKNTFNLTQQIYISI